MKPRRPLDPTEIKLAGAELPIGTRIRGPAVHEGFPVRGNQGEHDWRRALAGPLIRGNIDPLAAQFLDHAPSERILPHRANERYPYPESRESHAHVGSRAAAGHHRLRGLEGIRPSGEPEGEVRLNVTNDDDWAQALSL